MLFSSVFIKSKGHKKAAKLNISSQRTFHSSYGLVQAGVRFSNNVGLTKATTRKTWLIFVCFQSNTRGWTCLMKHSAPVGIDPWQQFSLTLSAQKVSSCPLAASGKWTGADCSALHAGVIPSVWVLLWECEAGERRRCEGEKEKVCVSCVCVCKKMCSVI